MTSTVELRLTEALARLFEKEGVQLGAEDVARAIVAAAETTTAPLTASARHFLDEHAGIAEPGDAGSAVVTAALAHPTRDVVWDTAEMASQLGVSRPTVTRRRAAGHLIAADVDGRLLFPAWQVVDDEALPGLAEALAGVPRTWSRHRLAAFMTTPDDSLESLSPAAWLRGGGAPSEVADLVEAEAWE